MSLIATLFTKSCAEGALVPAGGVWARATEANRPQPTVISSDLFMMCTPGSCGSRAAQLTNLVAPFWFRGRLGDTFADTLRRRDVGKSCSRMERGRGTRSAGGAESNTGWATSVPNFLPRCISGRDSRRSPNPRVALMHTGQQQTCRSLSRHGNVRKPTNSKRRRPDLSRSNESAAIGVVSLAYRSLRRRSRLSKGACKDRNARHDDPRFLVPNGRIPAGGHTRHSRLCRAARDGDA
jgi:hypothetical protein